MGIEKSIPHIDYDFMQYNQLFKKTNLTDKTSTMLTKTINELIEIDGTTAEGIAQVEAKIRALEIEFLKAGESAADFSPAMTYLAVLKYSAEYWNQHGGDGEIQNRAKWWETVLADAAGALVGVGVTLATGGVGAGAAIALSAGFSAAVNTK